ncbi:helix-turn-helix domain-containing protein [Tsukamurella tyrosinosolvens]|uniref:helix-turn-helix domain-containing protein n=1 Tax=Tsukamurella tyrosinosolvens TaxID=57704 RepID=UPI0034619A18
MAGKKSETQATGNTVAENIQRLRDQQRITYAELSRTLENLGRPIPALGIRRIESKERRVDVDDLVAIAVALGSNPAALLSPDVGDASEPVSATGLDVVDARSYWQWMTAAMPVTGTPERLDLYVDWAVRNLPSWRLTQLSESMREMAAINRAHEAAEAGDPTELNRLIAAQQNAGHGDD